ncbi:MAG: YerC/YecD family TrpR-related protein [Patescibacteria group bacterium]
MRTSQNKLHPSLKAQIVKSLAQTLIDLKDSEEALTFLADFFNESELETFAKRLCVAYWLKKQRSYTNIKDNLKVSSATIASVHTLLEKPGLKLALKKLEAEEWASEWAKKIKKFVKR